LNSKIEKWIKWINIIHDEILHLSSYRYIFNEVKDIVKKNKNIQKPSAFYDFISTSFAASALSSIRRQIKIHKDSVSLSRLLKEISENPELISRDFYISLYGDEKDLGNEDFDDIAGNNKNHIESEQVLTDLINLKKITEKCEEYVDKRIAHRDIREVPEVPNFDNLDKCIDAIIKLWYHFQ